MKILNLFTPPPPPNCLIRRLAALAIALVVAAFTLPMDIQAQSINGHVAVQVGGARNVLLGCGANGDIGRIDIRASGGPFETGAPGALSATLVSTSSSAITASSILEYRTGAGGSWSNWSDSATIDLKTVKTVFIRARHGVEAPLVIACSNTEFHMDPIHFSIRHDTGDWRETSTRATFLVRGGPGCTGGFKGTGFQAGTFQIPGSYRNPMGDECN